MDSRKALQLLGLAQRAGEIVSGEELTIKAVQKRQVSLVLIAKETGRATRKKCIDKCQYYKIPFYEELTEAELAQAIGKPRKLIGVKSTGFANNIYKNLLE
ncbi:MAG: ribosomal L7Ae/L30e/S12e/Gadd45 family protein [Enterococcaceae bacterium]|jgi:ribosomal protein L7Ae-like RNA K-turn-binding protein|nr:ribosomal L7Ae/L30e/S12e/Gadd45 family protein [Enterococcaceae bacterium]MCI1919558.1 ribosomal L7Ae/L30e/S12e/Gadd45 family protein [Enterococcaceae bacterium]